jgi:hypothetical protein
MKKFNSRIIFGFTQVLVFMFISACDSQELFPGEKGFLRGIITIGPICPVETIPPSPGCIPTAETYLAYPVAIFTPDGKMKIAQIHPDLNGFYSVPLPPGNYLVTRENNQGRLGGGNLPVSVSIFPNANTSLNIDIDTGIR